MEKLTPADDALWLRQSTVSSWELCPARVMQSEYAGFNNLPSEAMSFGTLVHEMLAIELEATEEFFWSRRRVTALWEKLVRNEYGVELQELASPGVIYESAEEAITASHLWRITVRRTLPEGDMLVERRLEAPLGVLPSGREVWLHGTGDLLYKDLAVGYDWKTSGRDWKPSKAQYLGQPSSYAYLHEYNHGVWVEEWRYWVYDRGKARWVLHETKRSRQQVLAWLRHAMGIAVAIDANAQYYVNTQSPYGKTERGWWCSAKYCGAWNICKGKYLNDEVDESVEGTVTWT